jgi:hypothetical protein
MSKKKKKARGKRPPKIPLEANQPRPKPISWSSSKDILENARDYPLLECWIDRDWKESGLARVAIARQQPNGRVLFGSYLVDYYCLGVKDCVWKADQSLKTFHKRLPQLVGTPERCEPSLAHQLIYGAINYAQRWGFEPHADFKEAGQILEPRGNLPETHDIQYGQDGKPLFISGPYDDSSRIISQLEAIAGEGNFDYLMPLEDPEEY